MISKIILFFASITPLLFVGFIFFLVFSDPTMIEIHNGKYALNNSSKSTHLFTSSLLYYVFGATFFYCFTALYLFFQIAIRKQATAVDGVLLKIITSLFISGIFLMLYGIDIAIRIYTIIYPLPETL